MLPLHRHGQRRAAPKFLTVLLAEGTVAARKHRGGDTTIRVGEYLADISIDERAVWIEFLESNFITAAFRNRIMDAMGSAHASNAREMRERIDADKSCIAVDKNGVIHK